VKRSPRADGPARLLAAAVALLPETRREWGAAMTAELASLADRRARWRFAAGAARAALVGHRHPATGWTGAGVGVLAVLASVAATAGMLLAHPRTTPASLVAILAVFLAACLVLTLVAPRALTSSTLARRAGLGIGVASGAGLLLASRTGGIEAGAATFTIPAQLVALVLVPVVVAAVARSLGAGVQAILWGFVFGSVTMFPVYLVESIRRYDAGGGLYLDGDLPAGATVGTNLGDAVAWLVLIVPAVLVPLGIVAAALASAVTRGLRGTRAPAR
jgi:hypothetical protein